MRKFDKIILIGSIFFLAISLQSAVAQTETDTGVRDPILRYGAKVGFNNSAFSFNYEDITDAKRGLTIGGFVSYRLLPFVTVQGELLYQQQGAANLNEQTVGQTTTSQNILQHNIDVPVFGIVTIPGYPSDNPMIPYISAGVDYSYNLQTYSINKTRVEFDDGSSFRTSSFTDVSSEYKEDELGILIGAGFLFKTEGWMYTFDIRYRVGMTNINNLRPDNPGNDFSTNVTSVSIGVGF